MRGPRLALTIGAANWLGAIHDRQPPERHNRATLPTSGSTTTRAAHGTFTPPTALSRFLPKVPITNLVNPVTLLSQTPLE